MHEQTSCEDQWALVTGASSGIGSAFAALLAARGAKLVLAARSGAPMEALAATLRSRHGVEVVVETIDLARAGVGAELFARLAARGIAVDILVNNAGFGVHGDFHAQPLARTLEMLQLNIASLTELTHVFANDMARRGGGHILLVASILGYVATPGYAAYAASKAYVLHFGEALRLELAPHGVHVTVLSPGGTRTNFMEVSGMTATPIQKLLSMAAEPVAAAGLAAMLQRRAAVMPGLPNRLMVLLCRLAPRTLQARVMAFAMR
jgi:short-subunit dehydrogenase